MAQMAQTRKCYSGTFTIDDNHLLMDIPVSLPYDPQIVFVEPLFTPTYGVNSTITYSAIKTNTLISGNATEADNNKILVSASEGRGNYPDWGYCMTYTYNNVLNNIVLSRNRIYLPLRDNSYAWQKGQYVWYAV